MAKTLAQEFLKKYMLNGKPASDIAGVVDKFIEEGEETSHGRTIRFDKARAHGLEKITVVENTDPLSHPFWEAAFRFNHYVMSRRFAKYFVGSAGGINLRIA